MQQLNLKASHKAVTEYYRTLNEYEGFGATHELAVRTSFQRLLESCARQFDWTVIPEFGLTGLKGTTLRVDAALLDFWRQKRGYWEAKDISDDLEREAKKKLAIGYPRNNIIFQKPERALLYQNGVPLGLD